MKFAITGSIGSGKSTASTIIRSLGYYVFDSDAYNAKILKENNSVIEKIRESFDVFKNGELDKTSLAKIIFEQKNKREQLEAILHPYIRNELLKEAHRHDPFFAEVPLLFEVGWDQLFDVTILIVASKETILKRTEFKDIKKRLESQMSVEDKMKKADVIIYNDGNKAQLEEKIKKVLGGYLHVG